MNTNHALHTGSRVLFLAILTALAAACGASPDGQSTVDEKSLTEPAGDPDAAPPTSTAAPEPSPSQPAEYVPAPQGTHPVAPPHGGCIPTHAPGEPRGE